MNSMAPARPFRERCRIQMWRNNYGSIAARARPFPGDVALALSGFLPDPQLAARLAQGETLRVLVLALDRRPRHPAIAVTALTCPIERALALGEGDGQAGRRQPVETVHAHAVGAFRRPWPLGDRQHLLQLAEDPTHPHKAPVRRQKYH